MYTFLVLGLIPGTNIQLSLQAWLGIMAGLAVAFVKLKPYAHRLVQWGQATAPRTIVHASQLHRRLG